MSINYTPRTWVTGEVVTAAEMNAEIKTPLTNLQAAWTAYTPALGGITLGNGVLSCFWNQMGKTIDFRFQLTLGTTSSFGAGTNSFALPIAAQSIRWRFNGEMYDNGVSNYPIQGRIVPTSSNVNVELVYKSNANLGDNLVTNTLPYNAPGSTDVLTCAGSYETT